MTTPAPKPKTAAQMLKPSGLKQTQLELMGKDVDPRNLYLALSQKGINIQQAVSDCVVHRTIEGASTVTVTVEDNDRLLLRSGRLSSRNDIELDGLFFRLVAVKKAGGTLTLTFEEREITILRTYDKPIKQSLSTSRTKKTRAQFILRMLREVKELPPIPYYIPELDLPQPIGEAALLPGAIDKSAQKGLGITKKNQLMVKTGKMTEEQRVNANIILDTGASKVVDRSVLVMAIMCVIQESSIVNHRQPLPGDSNYLSSDPNKNPVGCFQQIKHWGWPASRDVATDAGAFYDHLLKIIAGNSKGASINYYAAIEQVQHSGNGQAYAQWRTQAERIVTAYGAVDGAAADANQQWTAEVADGDYEFYRGLPPSSTTQRKLGKNSWGKEGSWQCMQRLAQEVNWRAFFVSGKFYFLSDDNLFKSQPVAVLSEDDDGIIDMDGDYDEGKKNGTVDITCQMGLWVAPPGSVIQIQNMGPLDGRWLVNDVERSIFNSVGTIGLKKPIPRLPEPSGSNLAEDQNSGTWSGAPVPKPMPSQRQYKVGTGLVQPVPAGFGNSIVQGPHPTAGLTNDHGFGPHDWFAIDFGARAGSPVIAVENGTITKLSGHDPNEGPWDPALGIHGPFGLSFYLLGDSGSEYYYTHLGGRTVTQGLKVIAGQVCGAIGDYSKFGGVNHVHVGVKTNSSGHPDEIDLMNAPIAVKN